ncbi:MAG: HEAT repeat domain-containing protein [Phycisphaerae bacterium]
MGTHIRVILAGLIVTALFAGVSGAWAQDTAPAATENSETPKQLWDSLLYAINTANATVAESSAKSLLDAIESPRELWNLSYETRNSQKTLARGTRLEGLEDLINEVRATIEKGYEQRRADPEVIGASIERLGGSLRQFEYARDHLEVSGEYALPQLIQKLSSPDSSERLKKRIALVLPELGKEAVRGLTATLNSRDPYVCEVAANALGEIGYPHAVPQLKELMDRKDLIERTERAARAALIACGGRRALQKTTAQLYYDLAERYYSEGESVQPDPRFEMGNVWNWQAGDTAETSRLNYTPVPREIFSEVYAMRYARRAIDHEEEFSAAVSLWLAGYLKREAQLPENAVDPLIKKGDPSASAFALAAGAGYLQEVLARALRDDNVPVAIGAIDALSRTSGSRNLVKPIAGGSQPLVQALSYPDRRVRFTAAEALAKALPDRAFSGRSMVMTVLIEAVRQTGGQKTALLITTDQEQKNRIQEMLRRADWKVIHATGAAEGLQGIRQNAGADCVLVGREPGPRDVVRMLREDERLSGMPVVVLSRHSDYRELAERDARVMQVAADAESEQLLQSVAKALTLGAGEPFSEETANRWVIRAADAIEELAQTGNIVLDYRRAIDSLISARSSQSPDVQIAVANALAPMPTDNAQKGLVEMGANSKNPANVRVAAFKAGTRSVRRFGNLLGEEQAKTIVAVVTAADSPELTKAASQLLGALNLPSEQIKPLILNTDNMD